MKKFVISRDDRYYRAWPDVALAPSERMVCVFSECTHHGDRSYTCVFAVTSDDRGRTWSAARQVTPPLRGRPPQDPWWNCPRISALHDGLMVVVVDRVRGTNEGSNPAGEQSNWLWFSRDDGQTWTGPTATPVRGIVPDQLLEITTGRHAGRWILSAHTQLQPGSRWAVRCWHSDNQGADWKGPYIIASDPNLKLCEGSVLQLPGGELVCFMRENSGQGMDAYKAISRDGGTNWEQLARFPLPGCHRPVAGMLRDGEVLITHRFMQGGKGWLGWWTQNFFAALTDVESCLATRREEAHTRIMPLDFDRSPRSDTGYSGWVQFPDDEIYVVNYIVDDAPKAQIRGYSLTKSDFLL